MLLILEGHLENVGDARFSEDGTRIVSTGFDNTIRLWETALPKDYGERRRERKELRRRASPVVEALFEELEFSLDVVDRLRAEAQQSEAQLTQQREVAEQLTTEAAGAAARAKADVEALGERVGDVADVPLAAAEAQAEEILADAKRLHEEAESARRVAAEEAEQARDEAVRIRAEADQDAQTSRQQAEDVRAHADQYVAATVEQANETLNDMAGEVVEQVEHRLTEAADAEQRALHALDEVEASTEEAEQREKAVAANAADAEERIDEVDRIVEQAEETLKEA